MYGMKIFMSSSGTEPITTNSKTTSIPGRFTKKLTTKTLKFPRNI